MTSLPAEILGFVAFVAVWLFPIAILVSVLSLAGADSNTRESDLGPNVVAFPDRTAERAPQKVNWYTRVFRLAFRRSAD